MQIPCPQPLRRGALRLNHDTVRISACLAHDDIEDSRRILIVDTVRLNRHVDRFIGDDDESIAVSFAPNEIFQ